MLGKIGDLLGKVVGLVDDVITSDEERLQLKAPLFEMQAGILESVIDAEKRLLEAQSAIIVAETQSESWLTRNWRPIVMLTFVVLLVLSWTGVGPTVPDPLWTTINLGLGGYIGGRSLEKIVPGVASALKSEEK